MIEPYLLDSTTAIFKTYSILRRIVYDAFDANQTKITRTQQIILITLFESDTMSMSELARSISTSNEQATRAVSQLVERGFVTRIQNENNRRIINISLTKTAEKYIRGVYETAAAMLSEKTNGASEEDIKKITEMLSETYEFIS